MKVPSVESDSTHSRAIYNWPCGAGSARASPLFMAVGYQSSG